MHCKIEPALKTGSNVARSGEILVYRYVPPQWQLRQLRFDAGIQVSGIFKLHTLNLQFYQPKTDVTRERLQTERETLT